MSSKPSGFCTVSAVYSQDSLSSEGRVWPALEYCILACTLCSLKIAKSQYASVVVDVWVWTCGCGRVGVLLCHGIHVQVRVRSVW